MSKEKFIEIFERHIKRDGAKELLEWLEKSDFFTAPASTRFHGSEEGGLLKHSLNVYERLKAINGENETTAICALLHDLCKVNFYTTEMRNVKENGVWVQKPFYTVKDQLPYGHGEKSVYIISGFMKLKREEAMAINWHMGGFDARALNSMSTYSEAYKRFPLAVLTHIADLMATYLDEKEVENND